MSTEYVPDKALSDALEDMLADNNLPEFNPIREHELVLFTLLVVRQDADGEPVPDKGPPVKCAKIPAIYHALTKGHYVILANHDWWSHANERQQEAALHQALMGIEVEVSDKGKIKLGRRKPDVVGYRANVAHFGPWNPSLLDFKDAFKQSAKQFAENVKPTC